MTYLVLSAALAFCQVVILFFPLFFNIKFRPNMLPLIPLAILGLHWLIYHNKSGVHVFGVVLWVLFAIIDLMMVLPYTVAAFGGFDRERKDAPIVYGKDGGMTAAIVYHPGGSGFQKKVNSRIAERLSRKGIRTTLYTSNGSLAIDLQKGSVLCLSSPVYGGTIRPPLSDYIGRTDLTGVKCYLLLTGWFNDWSPEARSKYKTLIESRGGIFMDGTGFSAFAPSWTRKADSFADGMLK